MASHLKSHAINSTADHEPGTNSTLLGTESGAIAEKAFGTSASADLIVQRTGTGQITVPSTPVATTDATSKGYVDQKVAEGVTWKEIVLHVNQLENGGSGGISQAILGSITANPSNNDTFVITDGTNTETYTFKTVLTPAAFEVLIGGTVAATMQNLVAEILLSSVYWDAANSTSLDVYFTPTNLNQFVIYRKTPTADNDRVYGTITGGGAISIIAYNAAYDYAQGAGTQTLLPGADPGAKRFGFSRLLAALIQGETHRVAADNNAWTWDGDDQLWQQSSSSTSTTAGDGIDITSNKVSTKVATAVAEQQYGGLVNNRTSNGSGTAAADQGYNAVKTDNSYLAVSSTNSIGPKIGGPLARMKAPGSWTSSAANDKEPVLAELNSALGTAAGDVGNWCFMVEDGTAVGSNSTFLAYKKANAGVLADYHMVELSA